MICPKCASNKTEVIGTVKGTVNERFRKCPNCGFSFQTVEAVRFDDYWREYAKDTLSTNEKAFPEMKYTKEE